jgi:hypothetical protein
MLVAARDGQFAYPVINVSSSERMKHLWYPDRVEGRSNGMDINARYACRCCGYLTLVQPPPGTNLICPTCCWEDTSPSDPARHYTSNRVHLLQAQRNFLAFGACEREWLDLVRAPTMDDARVPGWQPFDAAVHAERQAVLSACGPSEGALLLWLRTRVDDGMPQEIALADYGYQAEIHLVALRRFRDEGEVLYPGRHGGWHAHEVLALVRWSEPDDPRWKPGRTGIGGHLMRAFCCAVLPRRVPLVMMRRSRKRSSS